MSPDRVLERQANAAPEERTADVVPKRPTGRAAPQRPSGRYVVALSAIGLLAIASTFLTSAALSRQEKDAGVINAASQQVIRSRQITEAARELEVGNGAMAAGVLEDSLNQLAVTHVDLRFGDEDVGIPGDLSEELEALYDSLEPHYADIANRASGILILAEAELEVPHEQVELLAANAELYETAMGSIIFRYQTEAEARVANLRVLEYALLSLTIVVLIMEALFLFRPAASETKRKWEEQLATHLEEREDDQRRMSFLARFDPLTGLINRFMFSDRLQGAIARARREGGLVALMFLDLDEFKAVNDHYGHSTGDELLQQVSERLQEAVRESDTVARIGGDEFTIVLEGSQRVEDAGHVATKMLRALEVPYEIGGRTLHITASIGISLYPIDGQDADGLLRDADIAMYSAKSAGRNTYQYFTPELREQTSERLFLIDGLRRALESGRELNLLYQPFVDMATGRVLGVEALARWHHPELGLVYPNRFVPVAEETDLIIPMGEWVLHEACRQLKEWHDEGIADITVSVNVSSRQLRRGNLVESVDAALQTAGLDPRYLEIELTEGTLGDDTELARRTLERLRTLGVNVSIDDFGTGYSSLSYLQHFPIDKLKIDKSFINEVSDTTSSALPAAIIGLAKSLNLDVIAEGVETQEQMRQLAELGCYKMQGFLFSRPLAATDVGSFINDAFKGDPDSLISEDVIA
ncbi:MAG: EAL domain-containing protein [Acidimicrobiia bacterium]|nr:EAL domain-containing protein [Acidimicrobiia bacterium]